MMKPLVAAAALVAAAGLPAVASGCVSDLSYSIRHNPGRPLPHPGPGGTIVPGDPGPYVAHDYNAVKRGLDCMV